MKPKFVALLVVAALTDVTAGDALAASGSGYLPFPAGTTVHVYQANGSDPGCKTHCRQPDYYAWDFGARSGSSAGMPVASATSGTVTGLRNSYQGTCSNFWSSCAFGNYVFVHNNDGTYSEYLHMMYQSVAVTVGQRVAPGVPIGKVGSTGYTGGFAHLHYSWLTRASGTGNSPSVGNSAPGSFIGIGHPTTGQNVVATHVAAAVASSPAVTSRGPGSMDTFFHGTDDRVYHYWWQNGQVAGTDLIAGLTLSHGSSLSAVANGVHPLDVFARGTDGLMYSTYLDSQGWHAWTQYPSARLAPNTSPAVTSRGAGSMDVFFHGTDDHIYRYTWRNGQLTAMSAVAGITLSSGSSAGVVANGAHSLDLFARGTDGLMYSNYMNSSGWHNWTQYGAQLAENSRPAVTSRGAGGMDVFFQAPMNTFTTTGGRTVSWPGATSSPELP